VKFTTADLCDAFAPVIQLVDPVFRDFGAISQFAGQIETLRVFEDNALVAQILEAAGSGRVLVVDGGGSLRTALVGGRLAALAQTNGWSGMLVNGCIRDSAELREVRLGVRALNTSPVRSAKAGSGERGSTVSFAGVRFVPGHYLYADEDGIVVADRDLIGVNAKRPAR
jgi:regulator of ribonuclease activity A